MMNELDAAIESFSEALETPETRAGQIQSEALLRRGIVWFRKGDYRLALQDFADASGFSRDPRASFWEGLAHAQMGNFEAAVSAYSLALQDRPVFSMAHMNRGLAYMHLGRYERAIEDFNQVLRRDRDHRQARAQRERAVQMLRRLASR
jgi:tetratricopeptide (TPR) repeat protein